MMRDWGSKLLVAGWCAFLGAFTFLAYTDFALFTNAQWCGGADQHCFREWVSATSGWAATIVAGGTILLLIRQIREAARSVEISSETLNETRLSAERQQRAYVYAGQTPFAIDDIGMLMATLEITNHGQTPARNVVIRRFAYLGSAKEFRDFGTDASVSEIGDLAPTQKRFSRAGIASTEFETRQSEIENGKVRFHVVVNIAYTDIFGIKRETNFRLVNPFRKTEGYLLVAEAVNST